jgi:hypothetical protein
VDLYDTLRTHTPADPAFEIDAIAIPTDGTDDAHTSPSLLATSLASADIQTAHEADPSNAIHTSTEEMPVTLSPHPDAHLDDGVSYTEGRDLSPSDSHEKFTREDPSRDVLQPLVSIDGLVNSSTENDHDSVLAVPAADEVGASAQKAERDEISPHFEDHIVPPTAQTPDLVESVGLQQPADDLNNHPEVRIGASGDPLEISEGVYIDPPPAVLLSLPSSNDPKICLFNHPHLSSGSTTPSPGGTENTEQTLTLLLHHLPTLYYEPLASVFEALRQEESITQIAGCVDGELVLDAYDLHLAISEACLSSNSHVADTYSSA